jgi:hypothetical protein
MQFSPGHCMPFVERCVIRNVVVPVFVVSRDDQSKPHAKADQVVNL